MLSLRIRKGASFPAAAQKLNEWLQAVAPAAPDGADGLILLAHNGPAWDWPILTAHLTTCGLELPACVSLLACSGPLFIAGKERALHGVCLSLEHAQDIHAAVQTRRAKRAHRRRRCEVREAHVCSLQHAVLRAASLRTTLTYLHHAIISSVCAERCMTSSTMLPAAATPPASCRQSRIAAVDALLRSSRRAF
jgi:hypothetical protein